MEKFLLELGMEFSFIGRQYTLQVAWEEYFLDLLFYRIKLKCYVVIELKIEKCKPEYLGKMNFYLNVVDDVLKWEDDNKIIGIFICKDKHSQIVEYSLKGIDKPMVVSEYYYKDLPENLQKHFPDEEKDWEFLKKI